MRICDLIEPLMNIYKKGNNPEIRVQIPGGKGTLGLRGNNERNYVKQVGNVVYIGLNPKDSDIRRVFLGD